MLKDKDKKRIAKMWSKINWNMNTQDRAAFSIWKVNLWLLADRARDFARMCDKQYVTDAVSDVYEEISRIPILESDSKRVFRNECMEVARLRQENAKLREALKKARLIARVNGYSMREFAAKIGITPTQLSAWTDTIPDRLPDFKD